MGVAAGEFQCECQDLSTLVESFALPRPIVRCVAPPSAVGCYERTLFNCLFLPGHHFLCTVYIQVGVVQLRI